MVKYEYDIDEEGFRRIDRRGRILPINITEARRIESLIDLGWGVEAIHKKMVYTQDVSKSTTKTFIKNLKAGNIDLEGDYPAPVKVVESMDAEVRMNDLENRIVNLENIISELKSDCFISGFATSDCSDRTWKNLWGRL